MIVHPVAVGHGYNGCARTETGNHACGGSPCRVHYYRFGIDVESGVNRGVRNSVGVVHKGEGACRVHLLVVDVSFRLFGNACHGGYRVGRVDTDSAFRRKHNATGTVVHGVCHVDNFRTGGTQFGNHAFQHFRGGNYKFSAHTAFCYQHLLYCGKFFVGGFHSQVATGNHYSVGSGNYVVNVVQSALTFYFGNEANVLCPVVYHKFAHFTHAVAVLHETESVHFCADFYAVFQVLFVLLRQKRHVEFGIGNKQSLAVGKRAAVLRFGVYCCAVDARYAKHKQAVVKQNGAVFTYVLVQFLVGDGNLCFVAHHVFGNKVEGHAFFYFYFAVTECADTHFRSLGVHHDGNGHTQVSANLFDVVNTLLMFLIGAVTHVYSCHVHSCQSHFFDLVIGGAGRSQRTHNLCFSHLTPPITNVQ